MRKAHRARTRIDVDMPGPSPRDVVLLPLDGEIDPDQALVESCDLIHCSASAALDGLSHMSLVHQISGRMIDHHHLARALPYKSSPNLKSHSAGVNDWNGVRQPVRSSSPSPAEWNRCAHECSSP